MTAPRPDDRLLIGLCTFRRPEVAATLASLARLEDCGLPVAVAVADNDDTPSARALVQRIAADHPLPITYLHAPAANISIARNALLDHARATGARLLASMDDDEVAEPEWLAALVMEWHETGCGAILGPVRADYLPGAPAWMDAARAHDTLPVIRGNEIATGYTCNVLLDLADPAAQGLRFDPARGRTGGEDSAFFTAFTAAGGRIGFAPEALLRETVPAARARLGWLLKRRYRMGHTHASLLARGRSRRGRLTAAGIAAAKAAVCGGLAVAGALQPARRNHQIMRAALHLGAVAHLGGASSVELYGGPNGRPESGLSGPEEA